MVDEAINILYAAVWFLVLAVPGVGLEQLVSYIEAYPKLHFAVVILRPTAQIYLFCDAASFVVFVCASTLRTIDKILKERIGVDVVEIGRWVGQRTFVGGRRTVVWLIVPLILVISGCGVIWLYYPWVSH